MIHLNPAEESLREYLLEHVFNVPPDFDQLCYNKGPWQISTTCKKVVKHWFRMGNLDLKHKKYARPGNFDKYDIVPGRYVTKIKSSHYMYIG